MRSEAQGSYVRRTQLRCEITSRYGAGEDGARAGEDGAAAGSVQLEVEELQATIVGRSWGHGTTLTSYIRKTRVGNFVSSMSVAPTSSTFAPLTPQYSRLIPF